MTVREVVMGTDPISGIFILYDADGNLIGDLDIYDNEQWEKYANKQVDYWSYSVRERNGYEIHLYL